MKLVVATQNVGKLREFRRVLEPFGFELFSARELGFADEVEETGSSFRENAKIKAQAVCRALGLPAVADDSGLCVDALGGRPGIYSARYAGEDTSYPEKIRLLLQELSSHGKADRGAAFWCAICLCFPDGHLIEAEGSVRGQIGFRPLGSNGFGYDPVFYYHGRSFAQLSDQEKDAVSHRGNALRALKRVLAAGSKQ